MYHNITYDNGQIEQSYHFWSTNHSIRKIQMEIIKILDIFGLFITFMELSTENTKKVPCQFKFWMEKNNINMNKE
jgi:hypothetical protein